LIFSRDGRGWSWYEVEDGNGNGLRTREIRRGTDRTLSGPHRMEDHDSRIKLGFPPGGPFPKIPPGTGWIDGTDDPIRFGRSDLVSFTPLGTGSSGTLYVTDGARQLLGVVLFGPTCRVRVWRFDWEERRWRL
jgi:hypothetical protein